MNSRAVVRLGVAATAAALAALAVPVVLHSDWANTTAVRTAAAPRQAGLFPLAPAVEPIWRAGGLPPLGAVPPAGAAVQAGTVIVAGTHRIEGRVPQTGVTRWYYERRNATLCDWTARDGRVFAAFRKDHGCRDLVTLDAGTGARVWYRNAELNSDIALSAMPSVLVAGNAHALVAFDTGGGLNRWTYGRSGCTLSAAVPGDLGIGVLARCRGGGLQLVLVDAFSGKERFAPVPVGTDAQVLSTTQAVAVLSGGAAQPTVTLYSVGGKPLGSLSDGRLRYDDPARAGAGVHNGTVVGWTGRAVFGIAIGSPRLLWVTTGTGPVGTDAGRVLVRTNAGFTEVDPSTGSEAGTVRAPSDEAPAETIDRVGGLIATTGEAGTTVYG